jgi:hypothetical protein
VRFAPVNRRDVRRLKNVNIRDLLIALVERTREDFTSYFHGTETEELARSLIHAVLADPEKALREKQQIELLLPDTEDDGSLEASYALNAGAIVTLLVNFATTGAAACADNAISLLLDSADFRAQEALEAAGIAEPTEEQIRQHPIFAREQEWNRALTAASRGA